MSEDTAVQRECSSEFKQRNSTLIWNDKHAILVDCGLGPRVTEGLLAPLGFSIRESFRSARDPRPQRSQQNDHPRKMFPLRDPGLLHPGRQEGRHAGPEKQVQTPIPDIFKGSLHDRILPGHVIPREP